MRFPANLLAFTTCPTARRLLADHAGVDLAFFVVPMIIVVDASRVCNPHGRHRRRRSFCVTDPAGIRVLTEPTMSSSRASGGSMHRCDASTAALMSASTTATYEVVRQSGRKQSSDRVVSRNLSTFGRCTRGGAPLVIGLR